MVEVEFMESGVVVEVESRDSGVVVECECLDLGSRFWWGTSGDTVPS